MNKDLYGLTVFWSHTDNEFICLCPDFPGMSALGKTRAEAFTKGEIALGLMIHAHMQLHDSLPEPTRFDVVKDALRGLE